MAEVDGDLAGTGVARPTVVPQATWIAADGERWIGLTINVDHADGEMLTWFTGVEGLYRGRGVARALQSLALDSARELGFRRMLIDVASSNAAMLALNRDMGYVVVDSVPLLRKSLKAPT